MILGLGIVSGEHVKRIPLGDLIHGKSDCPVSVINAFDVLGVQFDRQSKKPHLASRKHSVVEDPKVR